MCLAAFSVECRIFRERDSTHNYYYYFIFFRFSLCTGVCLLGFVYGICRRHINWNQICIRWRKREEKKRSSYVTHCTGLLMLFDACDKINEHLYHIRLVRIDMETIRLRTDQCNTIQKHIWWHLILHALVFHRLRLFVAQSGVHSPAFGCLLSYRICARRHGTSRKSNAAMLVDATLDAHPWNWNSRSHLINMSF